MVTVGFATEAFIVWSSSSPMAARACLTNACFVFVSFSFYFEDLKAKTKNETASICPYNGSISGRCFSPQDRPRAT